MKKGLLLFLWLLPVIIFAQRETDIRNYYAEVNKQIEESLKHGYEGSLYQNQLLVNKNIKSWPAAGFFVDTIDFWYDDDPNHLPASERTHKNVLLKVNISRKASHLITKEEYLYKEGKLLFYFSHEGEEGNDWETRVWFSTKSVAFKTSQKVNGRELSAKDLDSEEFKEFKTNPVGIMTSGKKYQDLFLKSM